MNISELRSAMRNPMSFNGMVYERPNICERTFVVYISHPDDINVCVDYIGHRCYRRFFAGQMEHVLDNLVAISYIKTPLELVELMRELRVLGVSHGFDVMVEYVMGYPVQFAVR